MIGSDKAKTNKKWVSTETSRANHDRIFGDKNDKKVVHSSNLALRFYKACGWTREILEKYLIEGNILDTEFSHHQDPHAIAYYVLKPYSKLDMASLYKNEVSEVNRMYDDYPEETDLEFMERFNW